MGKYKVVFQIGTTKLIVQRLYHDDIEAYHQSKIEGQEIAKRDEVYPISVQVVSVTRV